MPHLIVGSDNDYTSLLSFLEQVQHENLEDIIAVTVARINMFSGDFASALYQFEDIINDENFDCVVTKLVSEIDSAYCYWQLVESGTRSLPTMATWKPTSIFELSNIQNEILAKLNEVHETDLQTPTNVTQKIISTNYPNPFNPSTTIMFTLSNSLTPVHPPLHPSQEGNVFWLTPTPNPSQEGNKGGVNVVINVYNIRGQFVRTLVDGVFEGGQHSVIWNGDDQYGNSVSSGIYFYRITTDEYITTRKMLLLN
jgi:hypothetical protein